MHAVEINTGTVDRENSCSSLPTLFIESREECCSIHRWSQKVLDTEVFWVEQLAGVHRVASDKLLPVSAAMRRDLGRHGIGPELLCSE